MQKPLSLLVAVSALSLGGCDVAKFAAGSTVHVIVRAAPAMPRYEDPDLAEESIPSTIATMEGLLELQQDNAALRGVLAKSYGSLGFGFFEEHMEDAEVKGNEEAMEHWRMRASLAYKRGRRVATEMMTLWSPEGGTFDDHVHAGVDSFNAYLATFHEREQAPVLFWACYNWARYIGVNRDNVDALADLPYVNALAVKVAALDESYYGYAPRALVGGLLAAAPRQFGGQPEEGMREMENAIRLTNRKNLMYLVLEANIIAVSLQNRNLFRSLLEEVINAPQDLDPDAVLSNIIAKKRAVRYLARIDELFEPEETPSAETASTTPAAH